MMKINAFISSLKKTQNKNILLNSQKLNIFKFKSTFRA